MILLQHIFCLIVQWLSVNLLSDWTKGWAQVSKLQLRSPFPIKTVTTQGDPEAGEYKGHADRPYWDKVAYLKVIHGTGYLAFQDFRGSVNAKFDLILQQGDIVKAKEGNEPCEFFILPTNQADMKAWDTELLILAELTPNPNLPDNYPGSIEV